MVNPCQISPEDARATIEHHLLMAMSQSADKTGLRAGHASGTLLRDLTSETISERFVELVDVVLDAEAAAKQPTTWDEVSRLAGWATGLPDSQPLKYPSLRELDRAIRRHDAVKILQWHRFLPNPQDNYEVGIGRIVFQAMLDERKRLESAASQPLPPVAALMGQEGIS